MQNIELEKFRKQCINEIVADASFIKNECAIILNRDERDVKVYIIGSVLSKTNFTENSDVDIGIIIKDSELETGVSEELSNLVQEAFVHMHYTFGAINTVVFVNKMNLTKGKAVLL